MEQKWERNFRTQMKRRREAAGESQSALAKRLAAQGLPFHQPTVQRIEDGKRPVRLDEAFVIAQTMGASVDMMTMSPDDEEVNATMAKSRLDSYASGIYTAVSDASDHDDLVEFMEALETAMDATGGIQSPSTRWLAVWAIHAVEVVRAVTKLEAVSARFHRDWEPDWDEGPDPMKGWPFANLVDLVEDPRWDELPHELQPKTLAQLWVSEVDDMFILKSGPFAVSQEVSGDGEHQTTS